MNHRKSRSGLSMLLMMAAMTTSAFANSPPPVEKSRFALTTNYLQNAEEGIYELAWDNRNQKVFAAVMDRVNRADNKGYLYAFSPDSLAVQGRYSVPFRAFSLAMNQDQGQVYVGHTQAASLRISAVDAASGKVLKTSDKLSFRSSSNSASPLSEHLRHMVYSKAANTLFISYSDVLKEGDTTKPIHKLLKLDGTSLKHTGEVENALPHTAYGLAFDEKTQKIYVGGKDYVNEIDAVKSQVLRTISIKDAKPKITSVQSLTVDSESNRIFVVVFEHGEHGKKPTSKDDGLYVFDLRDGKQLGYVRTGAGANAVKYNPKYNEVYVTNFSAGTLSVVDAKAYSVIKEIPMPVFPNQMALSADFDTLYVGVKEGFSRQWNPNEFVAGAKERILSVSLNES